MTTLILAPRTGWSGAKWAWVLVWLLWIGLSPVSAWAASGQTVFGQNTGSEQQIIRDGQTLTQITDALKGDYTLRNVDGWLVQASKITQAGVSCIGEQNNSLARIKKSLQVLGPPAAHEPSSLSQLRDHLHHLQDAAESRLARCKVLSVSGNLLQDHLQKTALSLHTRFLLQRGPNLVAQWRGLFDLPIRLWNTEKDFWLRVDGRPILKNPQVQGAWAVGLAVWIIAALIRRQSQHPLRLLYPLVSLLTIGLLSLLLNVWSPLTTLFLATAATLVVSTWLLKAFLAHLQSVPSRQQREAVLMRVFWRPLRFVLAFGVFLRVYRILDPQGAHILLSNVALITVSHTLIVGSLFWLIWRARRFTSLGQRQKIQGLLVFPLASVLLLDYVGYVHLANYVFFGLAVSIVVIVLALFLVWFLDDLWEYKVNEPGAFSQFLEHQLGFSLRELIPWMSWLRALTLLTIWIGTVVLVLLAWGLSHSALNLFWHGFFGGFSVSGFHVQPFRWLIATVLLILLINVNHWLQKQLSERSKLLTRLDLGSRHSILAIIRYSGFILAFLIALSTAGVALHNLAIIAGALSVGIGFGLQNIVNNFVSGIILLLERPIRVGDWVKIGSTEGYVQRLSIRYTLIQTFDRTEVFVPNSELIAGQVTNWMYSNSILRLMIPLRVHHEADIDRVRAILEEVGQRHAEVLQEDPRGMPPTALLLDVTENALVFYLRVYIADCNNSFVIQTELRAMAVEALFRQGIRLAHQQQDIHWQGPLPELSTAISPESPSAQ